MDKLYFKIGCCFGKSYLIELHYDKIIYSECFGRFTKSQKTFSIDIHKQDNFIKSMDILDVWSWNRSYINENVKDGLQWELEIVRKNGKHLRTIGSNKFPNSDSIKPSGSFLSLMKSIESLVDSTDLFNLN